MLVEKENIEEEWKQKNDEREKSFDGSWRCDLCARVTSTVGHCLSVVVAKNLECWSTRREDGKFFVVCISRYGN